MVLKNHSPSKVFLKMGHIICYIQCDYFHIPGVGRWNSGHVQHAPCIIFHDSAISPIDTKTGHNNNISDVSFSVDNATVVETCHSQGSSPIKPQSVDLNDFLFSDSNFDSSPLKQCYRSRNDTSLNEKVQEKSPNRLDPRGSPAVGPSNDSSSSKSPHSHRSEYHSDITLQSILDHKNDKVFLKPHKRKWLCHGQSCVSKTKVVHYHCPICKKYAARDFIRIVKHALVCFSKLDQTSTHSDHLPAEPVNHNISPHIQSCDGSLGLESCSKHNTRTHYHCLICNKHASRTINRAKNHSDKCKAKSLPKYLKPAMNENGHPNLQTVLVCPQRGIYLVRRARQGRAKPVHVIANYLAGTYYCELSKCHDLAKFNANSLNPAKHCDHVQAAIDLVHTHNESDKPDFKDLFKPKFLDQVDKTNKFLPIMTDIANHLVKLNTPLVKSFIPEIISSDHGTSKLIYYSVHAGDVKIKYYNRTKRVLVTYDRDTKKLKCECEGDYKCAHVRLVSLVVASDPTLNVQRPESVVDEAEVSLARRMMLENKQIPFYLDNQHLVETPLSEFTPHETDCLYCSIPLVRDA